MSAAIPAQGHVIDMRCMAGLTRASTLLGGHAALGEAIGVAERTVRAKINAERGISAGDIALAAAALDRRAQMLVEHAAKLRALLS